MSRHAMYPTPSTSRNKLRQLKAKLEKGEILSAKDQLDMLEIVMGLVWAVDSLDNSRRT